MKLVASLAVIMTAAIVLSGCTLGGAKKEVQMPASPEPTPAMTPSASSSATEDAAAMTAYALSDVAKHATKDDCWMAIKGVVYDVSAVTSSGKHAGGPVILQGCGRDATELFTNRPGDKGEHSEKAWSFLAGMQIGSLQE
ncbi:cytochrome b5 domain-containing protein [Candidatus Woesebacteria bacterium]|nr:cytochrome b5 domain-containing protein [Candidatus Woesebacteria bacterium]